MIDFTNVKEEYNIFGGKEKKKTLIYEDKRYLVKFPDPIIGAKYYIKVILFQNI